MGEANFYYFTCLKRQLTGSSKTEKQITKQTFG